MSRTPPDHRGRRVILLAKTNATFDEPDPLAEAFFRRLKKQDVLNDAVDVAVDLYEHDNWRHVMDALLISKQPNEFFLQYVDMEIAVVDAYRHLFFDSKVFRHDLDRQSYFLLVNPGLTEEQRTWYQAARNKPQFVASRFRWGEQPAVSPKDASNDALAAEYAIYMSHQGAPLRDPDTRFALSRWKPLQDAIKTAHELGSQSSSSKNALKVLLEFDEKTTPLEETDVSPNEVLRATTIDNPADYPSKQ
jgi:hypothetical protein